MSSRRVLGVSLVAVGALVLGCDGKSNAARGPAGAASFKARSESILERLKGPFNPLPNTGFVEPIEPSDEPGARVRIGSLEKKTFKRAILPVIPGRVGGDDRHHGAFKTISFVLDLNDLNVPELAAFAKRVEAPAAGKGLPVKTFDKLETRKTWKDVVADVGRDSGPLSELVSGILLFYADRFSGLGLEKDFYGAWNDFDQGEGRRMVILDKGNSTVITLGAWVSIPQARAYVDVVYFAHWGETDSAELPPAATAWGTGSVKR